MQEKKQNNIVGKKILKNTITCMKGHYNKNFGIFLIGVIISLISSVNYRINSIPLEHQFGLLQTLPFLFWVGFIIMFISLLLGVKTDSKKIFFIKSLIFFVLIWNIPTLFENNFSVWDSGFHFKNSLISQKLISENYAPYPSDWPGFFTLGFWLYKLSFLSILDFLKYYRIFASVLAFIAIWFFFKKFTKEEWEFRHTIILSTLLCVWHQFHYSPQSLGFSVGLFIITLAQYDSLKAKIAVFLLGAFLVTSHPTTLLILISFLPIWAFILFLSSKINKNKEMFKKAIKIFFIFFLLLLMSTSWLLFRASYTSEAVGNIITKFMTYTNEGVLGDIVKSNTKSIINKQTINQESIIYGSVLNKSFSNLEGISINPSPDSVRSSAPRDVGYLTISPRIRIVSLILLTLIWIICLIISFFKKKLFKEENNLFILSWISCLGFLILFMQLFSYLNLRDRIFLYFVLISPLPMIRILKDITKNKIKLVILIFFYLIALLIFTTVYAEEPTYIVSNSFIITNQFITSNLYAPSRNYQYSLITNIQNSFSRDYTSNNIFIVSRSKYTWRLLKGGILYYDSYSKRMETTKDKIYSNGDNKVYSE